MSEALELGGNAHSNLSLCTRKICIGITVLYCTKNIHIQFCVITIMKFETLIFELWKVKWDSDFFPLCSIFLNLPDDFFVSRRSYLKCLLAPTLTWLVLPCRRSHYVITYNGVRQVRFTCTACQCLCKALVCDNARQRSENLRIWLNTVKIHGFNRTIGSRHSKTE